MNDDLSNPESKALPPPMTPAIGKSKDLDATVTRARRVTFAIAVVFTAIAVIGSRSSSDGNGIDIILNIVIGGAINGLILAFIVGGIVRFVKR